MEKQELNIEEFFTDLDGGVFEKKVQRALSETALACCVHGKKGEVTLKFSITPLGSGNSSMVEITHRVEQVKPEPNGQVCVKNTTKTPMHVGAGGVMSYFPQAQGDIFTADANQNHNS